MKSSNPGVSTSDVEVLNVDMHGLWLLVSGKEYFLPFADFPWFRDARLSEIMDVTLLHRTHLRWESLDVDLSVESLGSPQSYPLVYS